MQDKWARWVLAGRFGDDPEQAKAWREHLLPVRDKVLENGRPTEGDTLLDVGSGDGLVAFGALDRLGASGRSILLDVSQDLLARCRLLAEERGVLERCALLCGAAEGLPFRDGSVDVVTTRAVLIYVGDKGRALGEFHRVLRPGGSLSICEPINRYLLSRRRPDRFWGFDVTPVQDIAGKVDALYEELQPRETDPMWNFDERDLLRLADAAGFREIHLELRIDVEPGTWTKRWEAFVKMAGNPLVPTLEEAIQQVLTAAEARRFEAHLRPLVEAGRGVQEWAVAYLWAVK